MRLISDMEEQLDEVLLSSVVGLARLVALGGGGAVASFLSTGGGLRAHRQAGPPEHQVEATQQSHAWAVTLEVDALKQQ